MKHTAMKTIAAKRIRKTFLLAAVLVAGGCGDGVVEPGPSSRNRSDLKLSASEGSGTIKAVLVRIDGGRVDSVTSARPGTIIRRVGDDARWLIVSAEGLPQADTMAALWGPAGDAYLATIEEAAGSDYSLVSTDRLAIEISR